jgi:selenophosphate synthase
MSGSSMSSTRTPLTTPVIDDAFGFGRAAATNSSNVVSVARCFCNVARRIR